MRYSCHERSLLSRLSDVIGIRIYIIHLLGKRCKYLMRIHQSFAHCPSLVVMMGIYTLGAMAAHPAYIRTVLGSSPRACTTWSFGVMVTQRFSQPLFRVQLPAAPCFFLKRRCGGMADATDSKPVGNDTVRVRLSSSS